MVTAERYETARDTETGSGDNDLSARRNWDVVGSRSSSSRVRTTGTDTQTPNTDQSTADTDTTDILAGSRRSTVTQNGGLVVHILYMI